MRAEIAAFGRQREATMREHRQNNREPGKGSCDIPNGPEAFDLRDAVIHVVCGGYWPWGDAVRPRLLLGCGVRIHGCRGYLEQLVFRMVVEALDTLPGGGELFVRVQVARSQDVCPPKGKHAQAGSYGELVVEAIPHRSGKCIRKQPRGHCFRGADEGRLNARAIHQIAKAHGGWRKTPTVDRGTYRSAVLLPIADHLATTSLEMRARRPSHDLVIIAEPEPCVRTVLSRFMRIAGYSNVELMSTASEVLALCQTQRPAAVATTGSLGRPDGLELVRCLRQLPEMDETPLLFMGMRWHYSECLCELIRLGVRHFLDKPYTPQQLVALLDDVLSDSRG